MAGPGGVFSDYLPYLGRREHDGNDPVVSLLSELWSWGVFSGVGLYISISFSAQSIRTESMSRRFRSMHVRFTELALTLLTRGIYPSRGGQSFFSVAFRACLAS